MSGQGYAQTNVPSHLNFNYINPIVPKADYQVFSSDCKFIGGNNGIIITPISWDIRVNDAISFGILSKENIIGFAGEYAITENGKLCHVYNPSDTMQIGTPKMKYHKVAYNERDDEYWVVGRNNSFIRGKGKRWITGTIPVQYYNNLTAVAFVNGIGYFGTDEGRVFSLKNGKWISFPTVTNNTINCFAFTKDGEILAGCNRGNLLRLHKPFNVFIKYTFPHQSNINDIRFRDKEVGMLVCDNGFAYISFDAGKYWFQERSQEYCKNNLKAIGVLGEDFHVIGDEGAYFIRTKEDGLLRRRNGTRSSKNINDAVYAEVYPESELYQYFTVADDNTMLFVAYKHPLTQKNYVSYSREEIDIIPDNVDLKSVTRVPYYGSIILTEENKLYTRIPNGYKEWKELPLNADASLNKIRFFRMGEEYIGFLVGDKGTILRSADNATTWEKISCPADNELNHITLYNGSLYAIGERGTILRSEDKGITWTSLTEHINSLLPEYTRLIDIDFLNFGVGKDEGLIITGSQGHILYFYPNEDKANLVKFPTLSDVTAVMLTKNMNSYAFCENGEMFYKPANSNDWHFHLMGTNKTINNIMFFEQPSFCFAHCLGEGGTIINHLEMSNSVEAEARETIKVYPNPATNRISIDMQQIDKIELYDASNRFISELNIESTNNTTTSKIGNIPSGMYLLKVFSHRGIEYIKFIKQ